ncbi:sigma-70 family RNA polymerase sigma factor [Desulfatiferula olefinivorans]
MMRDKEDAKHRKLIAKTARGDRDAFETLYRLTSQRVFFYLFRMLQNRELAEDIQIDVYTEVWTNAARFKGQSRVTTWLFGIARNMALNALRKHSRSGGNMGELHDALEDEKSVDGYRAFEHAQEIQQALLRLPVKQREVMDLVFFHDLGYKEVADILDIPENTVKTRVYHAKEALKAAILGMKGA